MLIVVIERERDCETLIEGCEKAHWFEHSIYFRGDKVDIGWVVN